MIRYISLFANAFTQWIGVHSGGFDSPRRHNDVDTIMTLDADKWNCAGGDLSSCVTNIILLDHIIRNTFGTNLPVDRLSILGLCTYIYVYIFYVLWVACIVSFSTYIYSMQ